MEKYTKEARVWFNILDAAKKIPGSKIDREEFLQKEYGTYCDPETVNRILMNTPVKAGIELTLMEKIAGDVIQQHTKSATVLSFAAGIPGGLAMMATIPADIAQFYYQVIVVAQKLAYIFGLDSLGEDNEEFNSKLTVLIGVMTGINEADKTVENMMTEQFTRNLGKITLGKLLDKTTTRVAITIGLQFTKRNVFRAALKILPLIGGIVSGGITLLSFLPMCNNLKNKLSDIVDKTRGT